MQTHFGPDFFSANRARLRDAVDTDIPIIIAGNGLMQRGADEPSAFHQDSNFWYLTGLDIADLLLVLHKDETFIVMPSLSESRQAFDGSHDIAQYAARSGIGDFRTERDAWRQIRSMLAGRKVGLLGSPPVHMKRYGLYSLPFRRRLTERLKRLQPDLEIRDVRATLGGLRSIKHPEELAALKTAITITEQTLIDIATTDTLAGAKYEYELDAALGYGFRKRGAQGHAFAPIVAAGAHATTLHYLKNDGPINNTELIVLDVGAEVEHYCADITRTISKQPISGRPAEVFHAVEEVQSYALSLMKPGILAADYEAQVESYMGSVLKRLGVIKRLERSHIRKYFPHATSHFLGLDTHDTGDYTAPWRAGMVLTCEPGIYIPEEGIGIRLEDDVAITESGNRPLSITCPTRLTPVQ